MAEDVRRFDVLDGSFRVLLRGTSPSDILPVDAPPLEPRLTAELETSLAHHDFDRRPIATGLLGDEFSWRIAQLAGREHYALLLERSGLGRRVKKFARRRRMNIGDTSFLRLIAGGYEPHEIARRTGNTVSAVNARRSALVLSLGYPDASTLVRSILGEQGDGARQFEVLRLGSPFGVLGQTASGS
jgi:hypothetical protein